MTKREKQLKLIRNRIARWERWREEAIKTLVKAETELPKLGNQLRRMTSRDRKLMEREVALGYAITRGAVDAETEKTVTEILAPLKEADTRADAEDDGLDIPAKFRREPPGGVKPEVYEAAHAVANKHNAPPTEEQVKLVEKEKRKVKEEHKRALLTGKTRKWPATGKDAANLLK